MFSLLVASHFICDFCAGTEVNADCFAPDVDGDIFMSKKRLILYFPL